MNPIVEKVYQIGIIPVIAFNSVDEALPLCKALSEGGLPAAEVTFRTACAEECIRKIHEEMPEMLLGAGTVLTCEQADRAMAAGASFIVAPGFDPEVCQHVIDKGGIMMPGTATAGEMQQAMNMGCEVVKFFPAEANGGVDKLKMSEFGITPDLFDEYAKTAFSTMGNLFELDRCKLTPADVVSILEKSYS